MRIKIITSALVLLYLSAAPGLLFPEDPNAIHRHGIELGKKKLYNDAAREFDRAIDIHNQKSAMIYHNKGWILELQGDLKGAIENYAKAVERYPKQIQSGEALGFLYYKTGDYANAVATGELVITIAPGNKKVPVWLPDAYIKKLQKEQELLAEKKKKEEEDKKAKEEQDRLNNEKRNKEARILVATFDCMVRTGYYPGEGKGFAYISDPGIVDIPETFFLKVTPTLQWEFDLILENPYLGALSPNLLVHREIFEGVYKLGDYLLGIGGMFNHYSGSLSFNKDLSLWDFKVGFLFGMKEEKWEMKFTYYPRFLPSDSAQSTEETLDVDAMRLNYLYKVDSSLEYYSIMSAEHYYLFNHNTEVSDFWGICQVGLGVTLGNMGEMANTVNLRFTVEYVQRFYLRDLGNTNPYGTFNGQGFLGLNLDKWLKGNPFSGFRGSSSVLTLKVDEQINNYLFLYQAFICEISELDDDAENHHEFNLKIGVGVTL